MSRDRLPPPRPRLLLAPALAAALALGACGKSEPPAAPAGSVAETAEAAPGPASDPKQAVKTAMRKFLALERYHATMQMEGGPRGAMTNEMDFVAPDRMRMVMQGMGTQIIVGDTMYMNVNGKALKVPMQPGTLSQWRDPAKLESNEAGTTVQDRGRETLDGVPTRKYLVHGEQPQPSDVTMWIGDDGLPRKMQVASSAQGKRFDVTVTYSRFNDPSIKIDPPPQ